MTLIHQGFTLSAITLMPNLWEVHSNQNSLTPCFVASLRRRPSVGTLWSTLEWTRGVPSIHSLNFDRNQWRQATLSSLHAYPTIAAFERNDRIRIAIVGGGIAGITAASAIATRLGHDRDAEIVVFEADSLADAPFSTQQPKWTAATARNANSIVPGAAMHIMSQRSILLQIARDTVREWTMLKYEQFRDVWHQGSSTTDDSRPLRQIDDFQVPPPYFNFHVLACLGPQVSWEQRRTFLAFLRRFMVTSLLTGPMEASERAKHIVQLAKANREALLRDFDLVDKRAFGVGEGFLSLHRSEHSAQQAVEEALQFGEEAKLLSWREAVDLAPHLKNLPFGPVYVVHRPNDLTANCLSYVHQLKRRCENMLGVEFRCQQGGVVTSIERLKNRAGGSPVKNAPIRIAATEAEHPLEGPPARFRILTADGLHYETDYVVLAAGINTPLLAQQVDAGHCCPTYPLRGYSLTLSTDSMLTDDFKPSNQAKNLLNHPMSVDQMYFTSVGPSMARLAGFGELVGYRAASNQIPSVGPCVLARYANAIFLEASTVVPDDTVQCFRPLSPDDLPIVGKVSSVPGLFFHTGHGTLGWTLSLATAECVAQSLCEDVRGIVDETMFELPDKTLIERNIISPDRF